MKILADETLQYARKRFTKMRCSVSFGQYVHEIDQFSSISIETRIADLHNAFADPSVNAIITVIGGYSCNQLLEHIEQQKHHMLHELDQKHRLLCMAL